MEEIKVRSPIKYVYSEKIKQRRRSLFPHENQSEVMPTPDNADLGQISPLSSSDPECSTDHDFNFRFQSDIQSSDSFSTPTHRNYSPIMSLSPQCSTLLTEELNLSATSPSKYLKTPNDSNIYSRVLPKLSRKNAYENKADCDNQPVSSPTNLKCSKVRTSLFPECDISLAPKLFYPTVNSPKHSSNRPVLFQTNMKKTKARTKNKKKRKGFGQINAGVHHKIKKPRENKADMPSNCAMNLIAKIKTYKKESVVRSEFNGFLKELEQLNHEKQIKLIQHVPEKNLSVNTAEVNENTSKSLQKRPHDGVDEVIPKRLKLAPNETVPDFNLMISDTSDPLEDMNTDFEIECPEDIDQILLTLDEFSEENKENESSESVIKIQEETLLSPTSEMCSMTSGMKLDSPRKVKNLNLVFQNMADAEVGQGSVQNNRTCAEQEYFPIFHQNVSKPVKDVPKNENPKRKKMKVSPDQMLLDAGQKRFGLVNCAVCNYVYNAGDPVDENMHEKHHSIAHTLQFIGWKNEHVLENFPQGSRVIVVLPSDPKVWIEKVKRVIEVINRDMGDFDLTVDISASKVYLYIMNKNIVGCLVAESKTQGFKLLTSNEGIDICSTEVSPIKCGISRIWVSSQYRRKGIATKLMEIMRSHFISHGVLNKNHIALSALTEDGKLFAVKYFQTPNFLTYLD